MSVANAANAIRTARPTADHMKIEPSSRFGNRFIFIWDRSASPGASKGLSRNNLYTRVVLGPSLPVILSAAKNLGWSLRVDSAKNLTARPFAEFTLREANVLRVTITRGNIGKPNRKVYILTGP